MHRLKQSVSWWCFAQGELSPQTLVRATTDIGYEGIELVDQVYWPLIKELSPFCDIVVGEVFSENVIHEGDIDIEHSRTETSHDLESDPGRTAECGRSRTVARSLAPSGAAYAGGLSKGGGRSCGPREPGSQAQTYHHRPDATAGDRAGSNDVPGLQPTASARLAARARRDQALTQQCASHPPSRRTAGRTQATQATASAAAQALWARRHAGAD